MGDGDGFDQSLGVGLSPAGEEAQHSLVAALFLETSDRLSCPPNHRMPPEQADHRELEVTDPMIPTADVDQLVGQHVQRSHGSEVGVPADQQGPARAN